MKIFIKTLLCTKGINPEKEIKVKNKLTTSTYVHVYKNSDEQIKTQIQYVNSNLHSIHISNPMRIKENWITKKLMHMK